MIATEIISKTAKPLSPHPTQLNPNSNWVNFRGAWVTNMVLLVFLRMFFTIIPGISTEIAWTLTNVLFLFGHFIMFHWLTGTPFDADQGEFDGLTLWEQIDNGAQFTPAKKFLTALPIVFFLLSTHYTNYDLTLFCINLIPLVIVLIGKLPAMHRVRLFGINKIED
ncbi:hypothetical protein MP638_004059 [Amoeboaphelidium occidentale]|nr:hypothetical protein MP638_004059 [Amoeboaphelidium occidentale]